MHHIQIKNQQGITLLLAVFILSGLILIAVTVSALAIQSIRNSRAVVFSEPAVGQAQTGAEEGLWSLKRKAGSLPTCDSENSSVGTKKSEPIGSTSLWSARTYCQDYSSLSLDLSANTPYSLYLYDPADPNGDLDLSGMQDGGFHWLEVKSNAGTRNVNVYLTRIDGTPIGSQPLTVAPGGTVHIGPPGSPSSILQTNNTGDPSAVDNRMILRLVYCEGSCAAGSSIGNVTVSSDIGMPNAPTINSIGCAQRGAGTGNQCTGSEVFNRKINVTVPQ